MPPRLAPFILALVVSALLFAAARLEPYFAGDVPIARAVQAMSPGTSWATGVTRTATAPTKYALMALGIGLAWALAGWKGAAIVTGALVIEQSFGEASKQIAQRPRPSRELLQVIGNPSGYSFPSTFTTFYAVVFGSLLLLARRARPGMLATSVTILSVVMIVIGWGARVVVGAHWPSDVVLATIICMTWLWATIRVALPRRA